jgi:predicted PurR-regulated permease PerM
MAGLIFLGLLAAIAGLWLLGAPPLIREAGRIAGDFDGTMQRLATVLIGTETVSVFGRPMNASELAGVAVTGMQNWIARGDTLMNIAAWSFTAIFGFFLTLVLLFYFLIDGKRIGNGLFWLVPPAHRPFADFIWSKIDPVLKRYFVGVLAVVTYAAVAAYIGLGVTLGIHHAVFLALITGILEMIPIVGPASAIAIAGLVAIQQAAGFGTIIAYAIYATLLRLSIDQLIGPLVLGTAARLHPTLVIFCFLAGGVLFGIAGVILAVPAALATRIALAAMYEPARA